MQNAWIKPFNEISLAVIIRKEFDYAKATWQMLYNWNAHFMCVDIDRIYILITIL